MEVPLHSITSSKSSLSKKRAIIGKRVRSALQSPYTLQWPMVKDAQEIKQVLLRLLTPIRRKERRLPWSAVKRMTPEERRKAQKEAVMETDEWYDMRKGLYYGMNSFTRGIKHNNVASAILSDDVKPKLVVNNIIRLASIHCIPILILPEVKYLTKSSVGFSSCCIAVKKSHAEQESSYFYPLHKIILELSKEFKLPENAVMYHAPAERVEPLPLNRFKKDFQEESFGIDVHSLRKKSHPYMRNFPRHSSEFIKIFSHAEHAHLDNRGINENLETERRGDTASSKSKEDNFSQACDKENPSPSIPVVSQRKEKRIPLHPYKPLRTAVVGGCRKSKPNIK